MGRADTDLERIIHILPLEQFTFHGGLTKIEQASNYHPARIAASRSEHLEPGQNFHRLERC